MIGRWNSHPSFLVCRVQQAYKDERENAWSDYYTYGGNAVVLTLPTWRKKRISSRTIFSILTWKMSSNVIPYKMIPMSRWSFEYCRFRVGSLPQSFHTHFGRKENYHQSTSSQSLSWLFCWSVLINKANRYDQKKEYTNPTKYYYTDVGLRNAHPDIGRNTHHGKCACGLIRRSCDVDVGIIEEHRNARRRFEQLEVDFIKQRR